MQGQGTLLGIGQAVLARFRDVLAERGIEVGEVMVGVTARSKASR
jgi:hypothetical protein